MTLGPTAPDGCGSVASTKRNRPKRTGIADEYGFPTNERREKPPEKTEKSLANPAVV